MAKTKAEASEMTPEQETQALIVAETEKLIETSIAELKSSTVTDQAIAQLKAEYGALVIGGIDDLNGYKAVKEGAAKIKKLRSAISKKREELTAPALQFQRALISEENRIIGEIKPIEEQLLKKQKDYEDALAKQKREEYQRRLNLLTESGYQLINGFLVCGPVQVLADKLNDLTESQIEYYTGHGKAEQERVAAEEKRKAEEEARLKAEREAIEKERAEIARMRAEAEKERAELEAQKKAIEKTYETVVQPEQPVAPLEFELPKAGEPVPTVVIEKGQSLGPTEGNTGAFVPDPNDPTRQAPPAPVENPNPMNPGPLLSNPPSQQATEPQAINHPIWKPKNEFERGFNAFRVQLVALVNDPNAKLSKAILREWAWNLPPTDTKQ